MLKSVLPIREIYFVAHSENGFVSRIRGLVILPNAPLNDGYPLNYPAFGLAKYGREQRI